MQRSLVKTRAEGIGSPPTRPHAGCHLHPSNPRSCVSFLLVAEGHGNLKVHLGPDLLFF